MANRNGTPGTNGGSVGLFAPPVDSKPATLDDIKLKRKNGKLEPLSVVTPFEGINIEMLPLTYGEKRDYPFADLEVQDFDDELKLKMLREHIVKPDLSGLTMDEMLNEMDWDTVDDLLVAIALASRSRFRMQVPTIAEVGDEGKDTSHSS